VDIAKILFDDWQGIGRTMLIGLCAYAGLVLVLRISGKRTLSKLNAFDLVVTVALGSTLATILLSADVALAEGLVAFVMLVGLQWVVTRFSLRSTGFRSLIRSNPRLLLQDGTYLRPAMDEERVTASEIDEAVRKSGFGDLSQVAAVVLETDGSFSVISHDKAGDRSALESLRRDGA
jgi:uncharacterized membrane protein YcaP (DUF421 family)